MGYKHYKIVETPMGILLTPPGHPRHRYSVEVFASKHSQHVADCLVIDDVLRDDANASPALRARVQEIMDAASLVPSELWIRSVYGYFKDCYLPESGSTNVSDAVIHSPEQIAHDLATASLDTLADIMRGRAEIRAAIAASGGSTPVGPDPDNYRCGVTRFYGRRRGYEVTAKRDGATIYVYALADDGTRYGADHLADYASALVESPAFTNVRIDPVHNEPGEDFRPERVVADLTDPPIPMDPERHSAAAHIRRYFPDHTPRLDLIADPGKGYGSWPCAKCGKRVEYEAKWDKLTTFTGSGALPDQATQTECPQGGDHTR